MAAKSLNDVKNPPEGVWVVSYVGDKVMAVGNTLPEVVVGSQLDIMVVVVSTVAEVYVCTIWKNALGVPVEIPILSLPASTKNRFVSVSPSIRKFTSEPPSLKTAPPSA
jgi:hypothetical protein